MNKPRPHGAPPLLDPANASLIGQQRVNAEIFTAMEILGRKLERVEAERKYLADRLAMIESSAAIDEETGKIYLPVALNNNEPLRNTGPRWMLTTSVLTACIALAALALSMARPAAPVLTQEQLAALEALKVTPAGVTASAWKPIEEEMAQTEGAAESLAPPPPAEVLSSPSIASAADKASQDITAAFEPERAAPPAVPAAAEKPENTKPVTLTAPPKKDKEASEIKKAETPAVDMPPDRTLPAKISALQKRAYAGEGSAQHDLGALYVSGKLVARNDARALYWFKRAAEGGIANAQYNLGVFYQQGIAVKPDMAQAVKWYKSAGDQGHAEALYNLGLAYMTGAGAKPDMDKALDYFKRAAGKGLSQAAYNLGVIYEGTAGGTPNRSEAKEWYKAAAAGGHTEAQKSLARLQQQESLIAPAAPYEAIAPAAGGPAPPPPFVTNP